MSDEKITLFANGCSHTAGSEIEHEYQGYCYHKAWPRWLADDKNWNWVNKAEPGGSNEGISRSTIEWITQNVVIEKKYNHTNLIVMILWSGFNRFEVWNPGDGKFISVSGISTDEAPDIMEYIKLRTIIDLSPVTEYKNLLDMYLTAIFLESLNIKYYFANALYDWPTVEEFTGNKWLSDRYEIIYKAYGDRRHRHLGFTDPKERFGEYLTQYPLSPYARFGHWGVDGHQKWKDYLLQWMSQLDNPIDIIQNN